MNAETPIEPEAMTATFVTGVGQNDTHAAVLSDGRPNPHPSAGLPYGTIAGAEIARLVREPQRVPKERSAWVIMSTYHDADARQHEAQRERGEFHGLAVDLDEGDHPLDEVRGVMALVLGAGVRV